MGQTIKCKKLEVQKEKLKDVFVSLLDSNIAILEFQKSLTNVDKERKGLSNLIKKSEHAKGIIRAINHYEILISLYNMYINRKETYFISICGSICSKQLQKWDKSEKGFKEFLKLEQEAIDDYNKKLEEKKRQTETIKKAREEGKKVEMMYKDGKITPVVVEDKPN